MIRALTVAAILTFAAAPGVAHADDITPTVEQLVAQVADLTASLTAAETDLADARTELAATYADRQEWIERTMAAEKPPVQPTAAGSVTVFVANHTNRRRSYEHSAVDLRRPLLLAEQAWNVNGRVRFQPVRTCAYRTNCVDIVSIRAGATPWGAVTERVGDGRWVITVNYDTLTSSKSGKRGVMCHELGHVLGLDHYDDLAAGCMYVQMADHLAHPTAGQVEQVRTGNTDYPGP